MFRAVTDAVQASKLYWRLIDQQQRSLTLAEAFYLATAGGGAFFGKVGTFAKGYAFDAIVVDDTALAHPQQMTVDERLERAMYLPGECRITHKYISGEPVLA